MIHNSKRRNINKGEVIILLQFVKFSILVQSVSEKNGTLVSFV